MGKTGKKSRRWGADLVKGLGWRGIHDLYQRPYELKERLRVGAMSTRRSCNCSCSRSCTSAFGLTILLSRSAVLIQTRRSRWQPKPSASYGNLNRNLNLAHHTPSTSAALLTPTSLPTMGARHSAHTAAVSPNERSVHSCSGGLEVMEAGWDL